MRRLTFVALTVALSLGTGPAFAKERSRKKSKLPTVAVVTTGGTIAEKTDPKTGGAVPSVSGKDLVAAVPGLKDVANLVVVTYSNIDSSQMTPELWAGLSKKVDEALSNRKIVGAVVTHGTDTMAEGAYFLDLTLENKQTRRLYRSDE